MGKFTFKRGKEKLSEQEIGQHMNFDKFISGYTPPVKGWFSGGTKLFTILSSGTALLIVAGYLLYTSGQSGQEHAEAFIQPPIPALDPVSASFVLNTTADTTVVHSTGSTITVPQNAFADEKGIPVTGNVELHYREFHDPVDLVLSGIPMRYDSAGISYLLESAGMFEITASKDGKPVFLMPGKELSVNLVSHSGNTSDYNIYSLDTVKRQWQYIAENTTANKSCLPVFEADPAIKKRVDAENRELALFKPLLPKKANSNADNFSIDYRKDEFPELAAYSGLKFEPLKGDKNYKASLSGKTWDEVLIEKHPDNEHYIVTFSREKESHSFTVSPVVDAENYDAALADYASRHKKYEALLAAKKKNDRLKNDSLYRLNAMFAGLWEKSNLEERFTNFISNSYMETAQDLLTYRTFNISKLGYWNSDQPIPRPFFVDAEAMKKISGTYTASFSADGEQLLLKNLFFVDRDLNSLYNAPVKDFTRFPIPGRSVDIMIGITYDNKLVYLKDEELRRVKVTGETMLFNMKKAGTGITSPQQLKQLLKI